MKIKVGIGYDVHKFSEEKTNTHITLGGYKIPSERKIIAHSDGDLVLHAITDSLLGAIGAGDIGYYFPPSELKWKNADSKIFVKHALELIKEKKGTLNNVDIIIICESPKINPHRDYIRNSLADILGLEIDDVNVKATTVEKLGAIGREEGIACQALACVTIHS